MHSFDLSQPAVDPRRWPLDPSLVFLNHGSFGSCPHEVLTFQHELRARMERQPVQFLARDLEPLLDSARAALGTFLGANPDDLAFVGNATTGVNAVLRSLELASSDELLVTNHEYNACRNALNYAAHRAGARVVVVDVPFPLDSLAGFAESLLAAVTPRTRLALLDHVTSQTAMVLPISQLVQALRERGVESLVDGAHAPGMVPLRLDEIGAAYYTGNCHKWICSPKGAAFVHVRRDKQTGVHPLTISHGANSSRRDRSRFLIEFGWMGTLDPTAALSVPAAIRYMDSLLPGGWAKVMQHNRALALAGREILCRRLGICAPCPDTAIGALASVPIPDGTAEEPTSPLYADPLQESLRIKKNIEVPVVPWPAPPRRLLRISAQLYNSIPQYEILAEALMAELL